MGDGVADGQETSVGLRVRGRVQGVGYRWWAHREAERLGVAGTVRNLPDGSVEVMARGPVGALERLERALRHGPPMAQVEGIEAMPCSLPDDASGFRIVR